MSSAGDGGRTVRHLVGGRLREPDSGEYFPSLDPATEEPIGSVAAGGESDVAAAVEAASVAQRGWGASEMAERRSALESLAERLEAHRGELSDLESWDSGNTIVKARGDVDNGARVLRYFAGLGEQVLGGTIPATAGNLHFTLLEPFGVVGRIIPFNHPIAFAAAKLAPPLMAGNTIVIKPPEQDSLSMGPFAELCAEVFPPGVVNIVTGDGGHAGEALVRHRQVRRVAFTGSVSGGLAVSRAAADSGHIKQLSLELGGKNALVALPDVPVEVVADAAVEGMNFAWQGQSCGATTRLLVHESAYPQVLDAVAERVSALRPGPPRDPGSDIGPVVSKRQHDSVLSYIERGEREGAKLVTGGRRPPGREFERGYWIEPAVFGEVTPDMAVAREEIFGPVLAVMAWRDEEELLEIVNGVDHGLTAAVFGGDVSAALALVRRIEAGYVWVNTVGKKYLGVPFGGYKDSGIGRENSIEELRSFVQTKAVTLAL